MGGGAKALGVVLAGGAGARLGGSKAAVELAGRPLISYPLAAFAAAAIEPVVVGKPGTALPPLAVPVVMEPARPLHPLLGIITALEHAGGRAVVTCPCDTPFVTGEILTALASRPGPAAAHDGERLHPLLARYGPADLPALRSHLEGKTSATAAAESLGAERVAADPRATFNVNTPADLAEAEAMLG